MAEKIKNWNPTCERFVAFLDIMGFRDRVFRESHDNVKKMLESLHPAIKNIEDIARRRLDKINHIRAEKVVHSAFPIAIIPILFSDSIILISSDDSESAAHEMIFIVGWILCKAINSGIPIKGAVAYGEQTADLNKSLYFGKPLIDAYELQNEIQLYGVVLHHTMERYLKNANMMDKFENFTVFKLLAPMKSGKITHNLVDWTIYFKQEKGNLKESVSELYNDISGYPRKYVDNTLEFIQFVTEKQLELDKKKKS
jgi:hypothetical protein